MDLHEYPYLACLERYLSKNFPYFAKVLEKRHGDFGVSWLEDFEEELACFFHRDEGRLEKAIAGYGVFALDAMRLQKRFDMSGEYMPKKYADISQAVYLNREYMFDLYLPGILLSQYLWQHHYNQLKYFRERFAVLARGHHAGVFYDIGVGTGFYSKEMLRIFPDIRGVGYDISPFSLEHTRVMLDRWGFQSRYQAHRRDIIASPLTEQADCLINVEVLEHLENPVEFVRELYRVLKPGGVGFITAAITAPNADHIYLYRDVGQLEQDLRGCGFVIIESKEFAGYPPRNNESVPRNGICIVTKEE